MRRTLVNLLIVIVFGFGLVAVIAHRISATEEHGMEGTAHSTPGDNLWNQGREPEDWWAETLRSHGHVGPWNVLGWRIGKAALREFQTQWGRHTLDIVCYIPLATPYSCMADGLVTGTGNSLGRLDIRLAEVLSRDLIHVAVRRKDGQGPILLFKPNLEYLKRIEGRRLEHLETLSRECVTMAEGDLIRIERVDSGSAGQ